MSKIDELVEAFKSKLDIFDNFMNKGVTDTIIVELETYSGQKLPQSYVDLLKKYNGEKKTLCCMAGFGFMNTREVKYNWDFFVKNEGKIEAKNVLQKQKVNPSLYNRNRIPFAHDGSGNYLCIDNFPNELGNKGQILYLPCGESEPLSVIFKDFDAFIIFLTSAVNTGKLALTDEREDFDEDEQEEAEICFYKTWSDDWTDIAGDYNKNN